MTNTRAFYKNPLFHEFLFYALAFSCMLTFVLIQPFGEGPDEINRFRIVQYICDNGRLPRGDDPAVLIPGYGGSYAFQPMLTYIIEGWLLRLLGLFTASSAVLLTAARLVNVCFGIAAAVYTRKLSKLLFSEPLSQWLFSCLVVFLPQSIFVHTYVNTDSCALFSVILLFYSILDAQRSGYPLSDPQSAGIGRDTGLRSLCCIQNIRLAIGIILCALSYYNAYGAVLVTIMLFISTCLIHISARTITSDGTASPRDRIRLEWRPLLQNGLFIALLVLLGTGWWFLRNAILYQGDFLGMRARNECAALTCTPEFHPLLRQTYQNQGIDVLTMVFGTDYFTLLLRSFVAMFGPMSLPTHYYIYETYYRIFAVGLIAALLPVGSSLMLEWQTRARRWFFNLCMLAACIIPIYLCVYYSYTWDFQPQGRYLMPMLPAFMYCVASGLRKVIFLLQELLDKLKCRSLSEKLPSVLIGVLLFFVTAALIYSVFLVALPYYR